MWDLSRMWIIIGLAVFAYGCGSIPFAYLCGWLKGIDLRQHGSRNVGATNAGRVLGKKYFVLVFFLDAAKGFVPTFLAGRIFPGMSIPVPGLHLLWLLTAFCAIAGHNWPVWLGFRGGKGVSVSLGVVLAIYPYYTYPGIIALTIWVVVVKITRYVSLGSLLASAGFLLSYFGFVAWRGAWGDQWALSVFASCMVGVLFLRHWTNIQRLKSGTENHFSLK